MTPDGDGALLGVLERARGHGSLGPGPVTDHLDHARGFAAAAVAILGRVPSVVVDLGTGGGVPGLVLACDWPSARIELIDASERRAANLRHAVSTSASNRGSGCTPPGPSSWPMIPGCGKRRIW